MIINDVMFNCNLEDIISELQSQLTLNNIQLIQKTQDTSKDIMIQCPYHGNGQERRPSAGISKRDGTFHCFACGEVHSLQEVIAHCFGHDEPFGKWGWKWLTKNFATIQVEDRHDIELSFERDGLKRKSRYKKSKTEEYISEEELDKYRYYHPYWTKRGITDTDVIELFDLGFDKEDNCITFPIRDVKGNCVFVARRSVKYKYFNYPKGAEKPLYGLYELYQQKTFPSEVIICESMLDALTAWQFGKYAVALNGLGTQLQYEQLRNMPCRKFILATDNDSAGQRARQKIRENIKNKIITEYQFPDGIKDLNDLVNSDFSALVEVF